VCGRRGRDKPRTAPVLIEDLSSARYAVAIQSDAVLLSTLIVALTSTSAQPAIFRPEIEMGGTRALVLVDQMRAVDANRLGDFAGRLDAGETGEVDQAIRLILGTL
jgi:mRNA interferase MazF